MAYSGVFTFGDSLVDSGNALKLAETVDDFPFVSLPNGAPTSAKGYYSGNFTNGWTFADLISNKYLGVWTKSIFPFGFNDPLGIYGDPSGNNLNFAYGGAQIRQGGEVVPDMDDQTDAYRDAVDGDAWSSSAPTTCTTWCRGSRPGPVRRTPRRSCSERPTNISKKSFSWSTWAPGIFW